MTEFTKAIRGDTDGMARTYEYEDETVLVADFGVTDGHVDVVDGTAIVVIDGDQHEFEVPEGSSRAIMNNGIVTIEVER
ncbi:hypothetical protein HWV23_01800 [Natronomonas halophila]|uniref:DUF7127 family protein n=1 Tax=Natronomonas halophila TaxID=2747817 RepID=UPI0015B41313|nr:hypothetical protein [Natronomonas halophila]QLD84492.1 hypothetical protein HWV23_01800 [Natronomonas halophila]